MGACELSEAGNMLADLSQLLVDVRKFVLHVIFTDNMTYVSRFTESRSNLGRTGRDHT